MNIDIKIKFAACLSSSFRGIAFTQSPIERRDFVPVKITCTKLCSRFLHFSLSFSCYINIHTICYNRNSKRFCKCCEKQKEKEHTKKLVCFEASLVVRFSPRWSHFFMRQIALLSAQNKIHLPLRRFSSFQCFHLILYCPGRYCCWCCFLCAYKFRIVKRIAQSLNDHQLISISVEISTTFSLHSNCKYWCVKSIGICVSEYG